MRASSTASAKVAGLRARPEPITYISCGMKISPSTVMPSSQKPSTAIASRAKRRAVSCPSRASSDENSGTKAALKAPSPNSRRNMLGSRTATWKASWAGPTPM